MNGISKSIDESMDADDNKNGFSCESPNGFSQEEFQDSSEHDYIILPLCCGIIQNYTTWINKIVICLKSQ